MKLFVYSHIPLTGLNREGLAVFTAATFTTEFKHY
jgi:hypothetical protein